MRKAPGSGSASGIQIHGRRIPSRRDSITAKATTGTPSNRRSNATVVALQLWQISARNDPEMRDDAHPTAISPMSAQAAQKTCTAVMGTGTSVFESGCPSERLSLVDIGAKASAPEHPHRQC